MIIYDEFIETMRQWFQDNPCDILDEAKKTGTWCKPLGGAFSLPGEANPMYGKTHTKEAREKISKAARARTNHYWTGKNLSVDHKEKLRQKKLGIYDGVNNPMYGKVQERIVCEHCKKMVDKPNYIRWHGPKCRVIKLVSTK